MKVNTQTMDPNIGAIISSGQPEKLHISLTAYLCLNCSINLCLSLYHLHHFYLRL